MVQKRSVINPNATHLEHVADHLEILKHVVRRIHEKACDDCIVSSRLLRHAVHLHEVSGAHREQARRDSARELTRRNVWDGDTPQLVGVARNVARLMRPRVDPPLMPPLRVIEHKRRRQQHVIRVLVALSIIPKSRELTAQAPQPCARDDTARRLRAMFQMVVHWR